MIKNEKMKQKYKSEYSKSLSRKNLYNPNTFNALDSGLSYIFVLLAFVVFSIIISNVLAYVWKNGIITDYFLLMIVDIIVSQAIIIFVAIIYSRSRKVSILTGGGFECRFKALPILFGIMLIMGIKLVFTSLHLDFVEYTTYFGVSTPQIPEELLLKSNPIFILVYAFVLVPLLPAICEEALFRGIIMRGLKEWGNVPAVILSSLMFSFVHGSFEQMLLQFLGGMAITVAVLTTKNFMTGIVMHFFNNLFAVVAAIYTEQAGLLSEGLSNFVQAMSIVIGFILLITAAIYFIKMNMFIYKKKLLKLKDKHDVFERQKYACFSTTEKCGYDSIYKTVGEVEQVLDEHREALYLNKRGAFIQLNKKARFGSAITATIISLIVALTLIFLNLFGLGI